METGRHRRRVGQTNCCARALRVAGAQPLPSATGHWSVLRDLNSPPRSREGGQSEMKTALLASALSDLQYDALDDSLVADAAAVLARDIQAGLWEPLAAVGCGGAGKGEAWADTSVDACAGGAGAAGAEPGLRGRGSTCCLRRVCLAGGAPRHPPRRVSTGAAGPDSKQL